MGAVEKEEKKEKGKEKAELIHLGWVSCELSERRNPTRPSRRTDITPFVTQPVHLATHYRYKPEPKPIHLDYLNQTFTHNFKYIF